MQTHRNVNTSVLTQIGYTAGNLLAEIKSATGHFTAMQESNKALVGKKEEAFRQNVVNRTGNLVTDFQAFCRLGSLHHIFFYAHRHSLTAALIAIQSYPHELTGVYMAAHLAIGQEHTTLCADINEAAVTGNAQHTYIA